MHVEAVGVHTMAKINFIADMKIVFARNGGANNGIIYPGEMRFITVCCLQRLFTAIFKIAEVIVCGADHRITMIRIAQSNGKAPLTLWNLLNFF